MLTQLALNNELMLNRNHVHKFGFKVFEEIKLAMFIHELRLHFWKVDKFKQLKPCKIQRDQFKAQLRYFFIFQVMFQLVSQFLTQFSFDWNN
jgi:hypothetical protein